MNKVALFFICIFTISCVESFDIATQTFENILVVEATITNEFKNQEINLSRTYQLEEEGPALEANALVKVIDNLQNTYDFQEISQGKYISVSKFKAQLNTSYQLFVTTTDGRSYTSLESKLTSGHKMDSVYAARVADEIGNEGISIFVDNYDSSGNSTYYRYEYDETYKILAPYFSGFDAVVVSNVPAAEVILVPRTEEKRVCFITNHSNTIIQTNTNNLFEDRVSKFPIKFIPSDDYSTTYRYSILVKQYIQSLEAYTFYGIMNKLSGSESLFSQNQPGFFEGNVFSTDNPNEKVLGFFEVSSVSSQRIYFKYRDFFPDERFPNYATSCFFAAPTLIGGSIDSSPLIDSIEYGDLIFYAINETPNRAFPGQFMMVNAPCGDCTTIGSNVKPDFWVD
jgi:uncharacterized protein DUF4249